MMTQPEILILAAGASSRMRGTDKLMEPVGGCVLIAHVAVQAVQTGCPVSITIDPARQARAQALAGLALRQISVTDPAAGMTASLQAGLAALPPSAPVLVLLADMPDLTTADLQLILLHAKANPEGILRACDRDGRPGHPVYFPAWLRPEIMALRCTAGPRAVLQAYKNRVELITLPDFNATTDLDTPEDWAAWRRRKGTIGLD